MTATKRSFVIVCLRVNDEDSIVMITVSKTNDMYRLFKNYADPVQFRHSSILNWNRTITRSFQVHEFITTFDDFDITQFPGRNITTSLRVVTAWIGFKNTHFAMLCKPAAVTTSHTHGMWFIHISLSSVRGSTNTCTSSSLMWNIVHDIASFACLKSSGACLYHREIT